MANLILQCKCLTVRSPASIATTDLFAAAGVGASGKQKREANRLLPAKVSAQPHG